MNSSTAAKGDRVPHPLALREPLPLYSHPAWVYLSGLSERSRVTMTRHLDSIAATLTGGTCDRLTLDWAALRYPHAVLLRMELPKSYAPSTVNQMLSALKRVLDEARKLHQMTRDDHAETVEIEPLKTSPERLGRMLSGPEIAALMGVCRADNTPAGVRDAALVAVLLGTGARRAEVAAADAGDYRHPDGDLFIRGGKGGKSRHVYLPGEALPILDRWLSFRGDVPGALLQPLNKAKRLAGRHLSGGSIAYLLALRAKEAGIGRVTPHDCRRTFASNLLAAGVDISTVCELMGHSSVATTALYDRRGEEAKRAAVRFLNLPF